MANASEASEAAVASNEAVDNAVGRTLDGRYLLESQLGVGGVGAVYRATQVMLGRSVAVKLLLEGLDPSFRARFEREAKALAGLRHPNVVAITDYGVDSDTPYLVMELLEGETLAQRLTRGPLEPEDVLELTQQLLRALAFVHEQGLVHRDLKPGNLFLEQMPDGDERLKVLDFGLAKFMHGQGLEDQTVTRAGHVVGTPAYMAPEQIAGDGADARTDTYAVGVLLFQMLTGRVPFEGAPMEQLKSHLVTVAPTIEQACPGLRPRPELSLLVQRALAKPRDSRFQSASDMLDALAAVPQPWLQTGSTRMRIDASDADSETKVESASPAGTRKASSGTALLRRTMLIGILCAGAGAVALRWVQAPATDQATSREALNADPSAPAAEAQPQPPAAAVSKAAAAAPAAEMVIAPDEVDPQPAPAPAPEPVEAQAEAQAEAPVAQVAVAAAAPSPAPRVAPKAPTPRIPARNPWARGTPKELTSIRKAVMNGDKGSERIVTALRKYNYVSYDDPRGHLLLGRMYLNRGWRSDAFNQYALAYQLDPAARGAPEMLPDLLKLVAIGTSSADASRLVQRAYGTEALPAIGSATISMRADATAVARLHSLRSAIAP